jgi:membrane-bound metal-dependent hydrolase YbcI (DUF457 family)
MTFVGHGLMGLAIGAAVVPRRAGWVAKGATLAAMVFLAVVPDLPLAGWGHDDYLLSHSIFINLGAIGLLLGLMAFWQQGRARLGGWAVVLGGAGAWLSHLLLDCTYNHGHGLAMFWPLSDTARLRLTLPWFRVWYANLRGWNATTLRSLGTEAIAVGGVLLAVVALRAFARRRRADRAARQATSG